MKTKYNTHTKEGNNKKNINIIHFNFSPLTKNKPTNNKSRNKNKSRKNKNHNGFYIHFNFSPQKGQKEII